jgi:O-antigen ligase
MLLTRRAAPGQALLAAVASIACALAAVAAGSPWMLPAAGCVPIAAIAALWVPFPSVVLFIVFSFFRIHEAFPVLFPLYIPQLLALSSLGALGWHMVLTGRVRPYWRRELSLLTVFFGIVLIGGVLLSSNRTAAQQYFLDVYVKIIIMTLATAWLLRRPHHFRLASNGICLAGALISGVALYNKANGIGLVEGTRVTIGRELGSVLGDPNDLSLALMFPMAFSLSLILTPGLSRVSRLIGLCSAVLALLAVIATQSRGGLLGVMTVWGIYAWQRVRNRALLATGGGAAALVLYAAAGISGRESGGAAEAGIDASSMGRLWAWQAAWRMALADPLTGVGLNNFYFNYFFYSSHWDGLNHAVHSTWFGVLAETGFLGLAVFVALLVTLCLSARRSLRHLGSCDAPPPSLQAAASAGLAGLLGTAVSGTFLTQGFTWPLYILAAFVTAIAQWCEEDRQPAAAGRESFSESHDTATRCRPPCAPAAT